MAKPKINKDRQPIVWERESHLKHKNTEAEYFADLEQWVRENGRTSMDGDKYRVDILIRWSDHTSISLDSFDDAIFRAAKKIYLSTFLSGLVHRILYSL